MSSAIVNGLAGAGGGLIAQIITYPLQTVNTRQQTERVLKKGRDDADGTSTTTNHPSGGTLVQMLQVIKTEGWGGLYSGLKPSLLGTVASLGVYYYFYQVFKNKAESIAMTRKAKGLGDGNVSMVTWLAVAASAGSLNVLLTIPIWVLVTRMQTHTQAERKIMERKWEALLSEASENNETDASTLQQKLAELDSMKPKPFGTLQAGTSYSGDLQFLDAVFVVSGISMIGFLHLFAMSMASEVYKEAGIRGFWKGVIPTLIMVCNPSIQFMIYETSMKSLKEKRTASKLDNKQITAIEVFLLGAVAKLGATVATYPLLVVKSRLQAKQDIGGSVSMRYSGTIDAIIKMIQYEGVFGFYKGMSTKIVQSVFAASVLFMIKEELVKAFSALAEKSRKIRLNRLT